MEWISVDDRLPDDLRFKAPVTGEWVKKLSALAVIYDPQHGICFARLMRRDDGGKRWINGDRFGEEIEYFSPTHWMPLPDLPEGI